MLLVFKLVRKTHYVDCISLKIDYDQTRLSADLIFDYFDLQNIMFNSYVSKTLHYFKSLGNLLIISTVLLIISTVRSVYMYIVYTRVDTETRPQKYKTCFMLNSAETKIFLLINVKIPTIVHIFTFIRRINYRLWQS